MGQANGQPKGNGPPNQAMQGTALQSMFPNDTAGGPDMARAALMMGGGPAGSSYQDQFGNPNAYAAAAGMPPSGYGQEQAWAGDMPSTLGGSPPPGFDEGRAGQSWDSMKQNYADPYTAYFGRTGPVSVPGSGGWEPGTEGLPRGPNGNVDWSAVSNPGDNTGTRRNDEPDTTGWASPADFSADATRMEDATFGRLRNLLSPVFDEQQRALENRLAVQGLPTGGEAYSRAYDTFNRGKSNAFENAALSAVGAGRQEQGRMFDQQSNYTRLAAALMGQDAALQNAARTQGLNEALMQRQIPQQELSTLLGVAPTQYPQFQPMGTFGMQAPDVMGAMNAQQNRQTGSQNALLGGLFSLGGSLLGNPGLFQ